MLIAVSSFAIVAAWILLFLQVDPVPTWFYVFAWYPTLVLLDAIGSRLDGRPSMLWRRSMIPVFLWSPVVWFCFEVANFRLSNWYYISLPHAHWERWSGIVLSFATVLPALLLGERLLDAASVFRRGRGPVLKVRPWELNCAVTTGMGMGVLSLVWPQLFFPLIWGAVFLILDPLVYRTKKALSLLGDLTEGYWGRIGRLLLGGLGIGLLWEFYNYWARGKWVYTVPWLEEIKLFEMPPFGFAGFPAFTLEAWSVYSALCLLGMAVPLTGSAILNHRRSVAGLLLAAVFSVATIAGMERFTISSTVPQISELPGIETGHSNAIENSGISTAYELAEVNQINLASSTGLDSVVIAALVQTAQLATLRGIGNRHAGKLIDLGIVSVCELSQREPGMLYSQLRRIENSVRPNAAEVRVWVRSARNACTTN
jgi:hypothetical protein